MNLNLIYTLKVEDEFGRHFEAIAKADAQYLIMQPQADMLYAQMMEKLVAHVLWRMGIDASAEWSVELTEEEV